MDIFETLLLLTVFPLVLGGMFCNNPSPPVCADDCNGNGYYLHEDESACIQCPKCSPGQELNKVCGNGLNGDAKCIPCQDGHYSSSTSRFCTPCTICINTVEEEPCQPTQDRVCGDCLSGFVRSSGRFLTNQNECPHRCSDLPRETPECSDWWSNQGEDQIQLAPEAPAPIDKPVEVVPLDGVDPCEPVPPRCIDRCGNGNYFLGKDGLCKACLTCQPGEELDKVCGRGKNGDAYCQRCQEGTFSEDGLGRCTPCRICVNTVATECKPTRDAECGECLPGYYQDADGFFPDRGACPNKCMECPSTIPQCQEWCESSKHSDEDATMDAAKIIDPEAPVTLSDMEPDIFKPDLGEGVNDEAVSPNHASYTMVFTTLASLLAVVIIILAVILIVFRYSWKRSRGSNASITGEATLLPPSPQSSPEISPGGSPSTVYRATTYPFPPDVADGESSELMKLLRKFPSEAFSYMSGSRPASGSSTDVGNSSSAASTPIMKPKENMDFRRHALMRQVGVEDDGPSTSTPQHPLHYPGNLTGEHTVMNQGYNPYCSPQGGPIQLDKKQRSLYQDEEPEVVFPRVSSPSKVVVESESGTVHPHIQNEDEAPGRLFRRRKSIDVSRLTWNRRNSSPGILQIGPINTPTKKLLNGSNGNTAHGPEPEAALFPSSDSTQDEGSVTKVPTETNAKSAGQNSLSQSLGLNMGKPQSEATDSKPGEENSPLITPPETSPTKNYPETNPATGNERSRQTGCQPYAGERNVTIVNINMETKGVETFHVGDVHNRQNYDQPKTSTSGVHDCDDDDEDETYRLLDVNMADQNEDNQDWHD